VTLLEATSVQEDYISVCNVILTVPICLLCYNVKIISLCYNVPKIFD